MKNVKEISQIVYDNTDYHILMNYFEQNDEKQFCLLLLNYLSTIINFNFKNISYQNQVIINTISYLKTIFDNSETNDYGLIEKLINTKNNCIASIKKTPKKDRFDSYIATLKSAANSLEELELLLTYQTPDDFTETNNNIVTYFLFQHRKYEVSERIIKSHSYLINICSFPNNVVDGITDHFIEEIKKYQENKRRNKDITYYCDILRLVLNEPKIRLEEETVLSNMNKITNLLSNCDENTKVLLNHYLSILNNPSDYQPDRATYNKIYQVNSHFSSKQLEECNSILLDKLKDASDDRRYLDSYVVTIDDDEVRDRDDGLSFDILPNGNCLLGVHIADTNAYCTPNSLLRREAYQRTQTIYTFDTTITLFPAIFNRQLSLDHNKYRPVRSYLFEIDKDGEIVSFKIEKTRVKISRNLSYNEANKIIKEGSSNESLDAFFNQMLTVEPLLRKRLSNIDKFVIAKTKSERINETYMVHTGYTCAEYFKAHDYPFLYRGHNTITKFDALVSSNLSQLDEESHHSYIAGINKIEKLNNCGFYSANPTPHEGIDLPVYATVTSPIRRYPDVVANDCIDYFYFDNITNPKQLDRVQKDLEKIAIHLNDRNEEIKSYYRGYSLTRKIKND